MRFPAAWLKSIRCRFILGSEGTPRPTGRIETTSNIHSTPSFVASFVVNFFRGIDGENDGDSDFNAKAQRAQRAQRSQGRLKGVGSRLDIIRIACLANGNRVVVCHEQAFADHVGGRVVTCHVAGAAAAGDLSGSGGPAARYWGHEVLGSRLDIVHMEVLGSRLDIVHIARHTAGVR